MSEGSQIIAMSGASGFVGSILRSKFEQQGWQVRILGRAEFSKQPEDLAQFLQGVDGIVNLAGAPVISRWTEEYKKIMYQSRVTLTGKLVSACALLKIPPRVFLSASAIGCYSTSGTHSEESQLLVHDFLGNLVRDWEHEAFRARELGIRTAVFRFGVVLGPEGGALAKMLTPFKLGLGGKIGTGLQPFSWIHVQDLAMVFEQALTDSTYEGIYNLTAPNPTTNAGLTKALSRALSRPAILPVPEFVLRILFGEGAQVLTSGQTHYPKDFWTEGSTLPSPASKRPFSTVRQNNSL